jgi:hypothetical protein
MATAPVPSVDSEKNALAATSDRLNSIDSIDLLPEKTSKHRRDDSSLSAVILFPVPPDRLPVLKVTIDNASTLQLDLDEGDHHMEEISLNTPIPRHEAVVASADIKADEHTHPEAGPSSPEMQEYIHRSRSRSSVPHDYESDLGE